MVLFRDGAQVWGVHTRYDARGAFALDELLAGPYRVVVVADGRTPSAEQPAEIAPAPAAAPELTFALQAGGRLHGQVTDRVTHQPLVGASVRFEGRAGLSAQVPLSAQTLTGDDGRFELRGVPPGRLSLMVSAAGHNGRILGGLEVTAAGELGPLAVDLGPSKEGEPPRLELVGIGASLAPKGDVIMVGQLVPSGAGARAGLVPGDALVAIDGRPVADSGFEAAIQRIRGAEGSVVVLRVRHADGRTEDLNVTRALVRAP